MSGRAEVAYMLPRHCVPGRCHVAVTMADPTSLRALDMGLRQWASTRKDG